MRRLLAFLVLAVVAAIYGSMLGNSRDANEPKPRVESVAAPAPVKMPVLETPVWVEAADRSSIDDSETVSLTTSSIEMIDRPFGGSEKATFTVRCMENTTSAFFRFAGLFLADLQSWGQITYRIDSQKARTKGFQESTNHEALGLWSGGAAIPFVKALFGAERLVVRAIPYNGSIVEVSFPVTGLKDRIVRLRAACGW